MMISASEELLFSKIAHDGSIAPAEYREHRQSLSFQAALHQMLGDRLGAVYDIQG